MIVILDTSIIVPFLFSGKKDNNAYSIFKLINQNKVSLAACKESYEELRYVISTSKFNNRPHYSNRLASQIVNQYKHKALYFEIQNVKVDTPIRDNTDTKFLKLAVACEADYLLTGDNDLLELGTIGNTTICKPREFVRQTVAR